MKLAYEMMKDGVRIWHCYTYGSEATLPECIEGKPVTELAPYAFSAHMDEEKLEKGFAEGTIDLWGEEEAPVLKGMELEALYLPKSLRKIGAYAFYNCNALERLCFHGGLQDLGAGLFTGCHHVRKLEVTLHQEKVSCLQEMLQEIREKVQVDFHGSLEARVVFPEFFEEGTENTPARNLSSTMHGSGMNYRYCFYQKQFDFRAYDSKFYYAMVQESFATVLDMVERRLRFPVELSAEAKETYENWLREHVAEAADWALRRKNMELVVWLTESFVLSHKEARELLQQMTRSAGSLGFAEAAGYLLDVTHRHFKPKTKKFEL